METTSPISKNSKILQLLRVKPEEKKIVFLVFLFAFFVGIVQNILCSIPLAMFLAHYESSLLPYMYVGSGAALFVAGFAFSYLERSFTLFNVFAIPIGLFAVSLLLFWGALQVVEEDWIFLALLIWSTLVCFLMITILMLLSNQLFTTQQSKRLFGLIWCGVGVGGILIGFGMDLLVQLIGSNGIILLSGIILFLGLLTQFAIRGASGTRLCHTEEVEGESNAKVSLDSFKNKRYILYIFFLTALIYLVFYSFDLLFNTAVQKQFPTEDAMAAFYGVLFATYDVASLFTSFFLSPWILSRFGLITSLLVWPIGLAMFLSIAFCFNLIPSFAGLIFPILLLTSVFEIVLVETITFESILLLFQPLRPLQRSWAQMKNEAIVVPLAMAFVGAILVCIDKYIGIHLSVMALIIVVASLVGVVIIWLVLKKGYLNLLVESLSKRSIVNPQFTKLDKESLGILKGHLNSRYAEEVIYVLQTIENVDRAEFEKVLLEGITHPLDEVRCFSLAKVEQYRLNSMQGKVQQICEQEENPVVLGSALLALGAIADLAQFPWFTKYLHDVAMETACSSLVALVKYGSAAQKNEAMAIVMVKASSAQVADRLIAARVLRDAELERKTELLLPLLKDVNLDVRLLASEGVRVADERLYTALIENLEVPHLHDAAMRSLSNLGKGALDYSAAHFANFGEGIQVELINLLGMISIPEALHQLLKLLPNASRRLLHNILLALKRHAYKAGNEEEIALVARLLQAENKNIIQLQEMIQFFTFEKTVVLHALLCREIELSQECCFLLLQFIYPETSILKAQKGLQSEDADLMSNAEELLMQTLTSADQQLLLSQLSFHPGKEKKNEAPEAEQLEPLLVQVIERAAFCFIPAIAAAVTYTIGLLQLKNLTALVQKQEVQNDPLMSEIKPWALLKLE